MEYLLKVSRLGSRTIIYGIGIGDDKTTTFDIMTKDFISESSLPSTPVSTSTSSGDAAHIIQSIFVSLSRLSDLGSLLRLNVIQKLMPSLQKAGYEETSSQPSTTEQPRETDDPAARNARQPPPGYNPLQDDPHFPYPARPYPLADPLVGPRRPLPAGDFPPPGFEDEYEINRPPRDLYPQHGGGGFPRIGERDLYPPGMGPNDPLRIGGVGGGIRGGGGGGMHPTLDDPMFGGRGGGVGEYDPQAPPGARFDPVGPGNGPMRGAGGGRFGGFGGAPPNPFGGFGGGDFI